MFITFAQLFYLHSPIYAVFVCPILCVNLRLHLYKTESCSAPCRGFRARHTLLVGDPNQKIFPEKYKPEEKDESDEKGTTKTKGAHGQTKAKLNAVAAFA